MASAEDLQDAVADEIRRYGSLDAAISGLSNDSCGAPMGARVHAVLNAALEERSHRVATAASLATMAPLFAMLAGARV